VPAIRACEPIGCAVASNSCVPAEQSCRRPRGNKRRGTRRERTGVVSNLKDLTVRIRLTGRCRLGEVAVSVAATSVDAATPRRASLVSSVFVKRTCVRTPNCASISLSQGTSVGGRTGWIRSCRNERSWILRRLSAIRKSRFPGCAYSMLFGPSEELPPERSHAIERYS